MELMCTTAGFREITDSGLREINGGGLGSAILAGIVGAVCVAVLSDWDNFKNGLMGYPEVKN